jgi:chemotaxis family two-component system sensor kinase Cph1
MAENSVDRPSQWQTEGGLERLLATALHDVRNPLNAASLHAQLLVKRYGKDMPAEAMRIASEIPRQLTKARKVLDGFETFVEVLYAPSTCDLVSLEDAVDSAIRSLESEFRGWNGRLERSPLPSVRGNGDQFREVFKQILSNALRFSEGAHPVICITCLSSESVCTVSVRDSGPGFDAKWALEIFEPFKKLHGPDVSGVGLGLALCREVMSRHRGRIWAESTVGEGSVFHLEFPPVGDSPKAEQPEALQTVFL